MSMLEEALKSIAKEDIEVTELKKEEPPEPPQKHESESLVEIEIGPMEPPEFIESPFPEPKPMIYLTDKELPNIKDYSLEDEIFIAIQGKVKHLGSCEMGRMKEKKPETKFNIDIEIESIADITKAKEKE